MESPLFRRSDLASAMVYVLGLFLTSEHVLQAQQACLTRAWDAFNKKDYKGAISSAEECIDDFAARADKQQAALASRWNCEKDFIGAVPNDADRKKVSENWAVNDVSAAYWIKGRSAEYLCRSKTKVDLAKYRKLAEAGYEGARTLSCGRVWDPRDKGFFWSPAESASERLPVKCE